MTQPDLTKYRWAAIKAGRTAWRSYGRTIDQDDADGAALLALAECPRTFDAKRWGDWGTSACDGVFGEYVKKAAWNAVQRLSLKERGLDVMRKRDLRKAEPEAGDRKEELRQWAAGDPERMAAVRAVLQGKAPTRRGCRMLSSSQAAKSLRMADRRLRDLCERGVLAAQRADAGAWQVPASEVCRYRRRRVRAVLENGGTYREAQKAGRCSLDTVHRAAAGKVQRRRGRPAKHDHELVLSMLTDAAAHPQVWNEGRPVFRRIARAAGCQLQVVQRAANC